MKEMLEDGADEEGHQDMVFEVEPLGGEKLLVFVGASLRWQRENIIDWGPNISMGFQWGGADGGDDGEGAVLDLSHLDVQMSIADGTHFTQVTFSTL